LRVRGQPAPETAGIGREIREPLPDDVMTEGLDGRGTDLIAAADRERRPWPSASSVRMA
jgi:hypothetical protein